MGNRGGKKKKRKLDTHANEGEHVPLIVLVPEKLEGMGVRKEKEKTVDPCVDRLSGECVRCKR